MEELKPEILPPALTRSYWFHYGLRSDLLTQYPKQKWGKISLLGFMPPFYNHKYGESRRGIHSGKEGKYKNGEWGWVPELHPRLHLSPHSFSSLFVLIYVKIRPTLILPDDVLLWYQYLSFQHVLNAHLMTHWGYITCMQKDQTPEWLLNCTKCV